MQVITVDKEPLVSVIMLTYNHEKYIRQALDSVLMQKVDFDYEILIGDDCSTDSTAQILLEYQQKYPDKICLRLRHKNIGATKNAYELLMIARGDYLATCEGDDYWTNINKLQIQIDFLKDNEKFIGCTHNFIIVNDEDKVMKNQKLFWVKQKEVFTLDDFAGIYLPGQPSTFVRRNIFKHNKDDYSALYTSNKHIGDRILMAMFLVNGDFYFINKKMSCYRKGKGNHITNKIYGDSIKKYNVDLQLNREIEHFLSNKMNQKIIFKERREQIKFDLLISFFRKPSKNLFQLLRKELDIKNGVPLKDFFYYVLKKVYIKI